MNLFFKIFAGVFTILFGYAMVVQFNDPDAIKWIGYYGMAALASILFLFKQLKAFTYFILGGFFLVLCYLYWPNAFEGVQLDQGMKTENIEKGRESLGSLIAAIVLFIYGIATLFNKR